MGFSFSDIFSGNTKKQKNTGNIQAAGIKLFGDDQFSYSPVDSRDQSTQNNQQYITIIGSNTGGVGGVTTKKEATTTSSPSQSQEKPLSFAPALIGGGTNAATGGGDAKSGLDILPIVAVGGLVFLGALYLPKGRKK